MAKDILCTLGPVSLNERVIRRLEDLGVALFRLNLSHTPLDDLAAAIRTIQTHSRVPVCLDTEGAQIRTGRLADGAVELREHGLIRVCRQRVPGDAYRMNFYPREIVERLEVGDFISIDFAAALVQMVARETHGDGTAAVMRVVHGGAVGSNKAVTVDRPIDLPPLTEKDVKSLAVGLKLGVRHFALSFANRQSDVEALRAIVGPDPIVYAKIESIAGLQHLDRIAAVSDGLLIDRGDLSRQVPIEEIPRVQKEIIRCGKAAGRKVYVATNLLESMVASPTPTRAEANDIFNTLADGADGLVLAAETAIGRHPIDCVGMVVKMIQNFERPRPTSAQLPEPISLLPEPHGGRLVLRIASEADRAGIDRLPTLAVRETDLMDCEQIATGTYSPLAGPMDRATLDSVLNANRLPDGTPWTLPVILQVDGAAPARLGAGARVALTDAAGAVRSLLDVAEVFPIDLEKIAKAWFGTVTREHPGVDRLLRNGPWCVAGRVTLVEPLPSPWRHYQLTPSQTRFVFAHKGWSRVVGFHTRNVVHRVHYHIQLQALERCEADGLYISPVLGPKKRNDFLPGPVLKSYELLLAFGLYEKGRVVLGGFATYPRYSGPREAVFTALCRKNMGCSHFIVGRDHTGVGDFYPADANRRLFESFDDLGIEAVYFDPIGFDPETRAYVSAASSGALLPISGTRARETLLAGGRLPNWFMDEIVQDMLHDEIRAGRQVFYP